MVTRYTQQVVIQAVTRFLDRTASHSTQRSPYNYSHDNPKFYRATNNSNPRVKKKFNTVPNFVKIYYLIFNPERICTSKYSGLSHISVFPKM